LQRDFQVFFVGRLFQRPEHGVRRHDDTGRTETALRPVTFRYPFLYGVQSRPCVADAFHGYHGAPVHADHGTQTRVHGHVSTTRVSSKSKNIRLRMHVHV